MGGRASRGALGWCIIFCLLFVLLFIDRLIVTLDMSVVMEDLGTKTQVAAPRHRRTSQTGKLIKHDQYFPLPLYPFIYSFLSLGLYSCGRKKKACCQKCRDGPPVSHNTTIIESHFLVFFLCIDTAGLHSKGVNMWYGVQYKHCGL